MAWTGRQRLHAHGDESELASRALNAMQSPLREGTPESIGLGTPVHELYLSEAGQTFPYNGTQIGASDDGI